MKRLAIFGFALGAGLAAATAVHAGATLTHVHGLAYSADGKRLMIPSHHGLAIYEHGKWSKAPGPQHDYMGFSATDASAEEMASGDLIQINALADAYTMISPCS